MGSFAPTKQLIHPAKIIFLMQDRRHLQSSLEQLGEHSELYRDGQSGNTQ